MIGIRQNLAYWTLYVLLNASGSFAFAYQGEWNTAQAIGGMLAGIAVFIALYTGVWSSGWFQSRVPVGGLAGRALLYAVRIRSAIALAGLGYGLVRSSVPQGLLAAVCIFFTPDLLLGALAYGIILHLGRTEPVRLWRIAIAGPDPAQRAHNVLVGDVNSLLPTFLITITEGFFLTLMLLVIAGLCWLLMRCWATWIRKVASPVPT